MTLQEFYTQWYCNHPLLTVLTSGSTGQPKEMQVPKVNMIHSAQMTLEFLAIPPQSTALLCLPLAYIAGKMLVIRSIVGNLRLINVPVSSHPLANLTEPPYFAAMVPMQVEQSLKIPQEAALLRGIHHLIIGGSGISPTLAKEVADFPNAVWSTYGMTETLSHIAMRRLNGPQASVTYTPLPQVHLSQDADGALIIDAPRLSATPLHTNDLVTIHKDGSFTLLGRKDNVVNSGGIKLHLEALEQMLMPHINTPFLLTSAPHDTLGECLVMLYVDTNMTTATLSKICKEILPPYHAPKHYLFIETLPFTPNGKPARAQAKKLATALL